MAPVPAPVAPLVGRELLKVDLIWAGVVVALVLVVLFFLEVARGVGVPLFTATALAYVLGPIASALERRGLSRTAAVALLFLCGLGTMAGLLMFVVPSLDDEATKIPVFVEKAAGRLIPLVDRYFGVHTTWTSSKVTAALAQKLSSMGQEVAPIVVKALGSTASLLVFLLGLLVVPVIAFHFMRLSPEVIRAAESLVPPRYRPHVVSRFQEVDRVLGAFVRGQLTVGAILAAIYAVGFSAAGIDMALGIALVGGFGNMVPYAGTAMAMVLGGLSLLVSSVAPWQVGVAGAAFLLAQILEPLVITPRIVGTRVGLHPVAIILAVLGYGELFGFVGVLLAVPTTAALTVVAKVLLARYRESTLYLGR